MKCTRIVNSKYWEQRYQKGQTGWDMNMVSPPIKKYIESLQNKNQHILIPGAGNAYEAEFLYASGFTNTHVVEFANTPIQNFVHRFPDFPKENIQPIDFFKLSGKYDLIIEQTFFCAIPPHKRKDYAIKMYNLLKPYGILAGLLFNFPLSEEGPPYGGSIKEYRLNFQDLFTIQKLEPCYNSHPKRKGKELFILFKK